MIGENVKLYKILEEQNRVILLETIQIGTDRKVVVSVGKYKFVIIINGKEIESDFLEVKRDETTYVEF